MDYYYTSTPSVSSRGRFSSRGGGGGGGGGSAYRGNGRGESSYRGSRGGGYSSPRGYTSSRGRGNYYPKYETPSSKYTSDGGPRYTSHTRIEETSYRKPESSYASLRDHSHHRSEIDIGRKRMRSDSYSQSQGTTASRRSHEVEDYRGGGGGSGVGVGGGGGSGSRYSNTNSYTESRSYSENRGVFKKPRLSEYKSKEEYRDRKEISRSSVAVSKLRSFRGRTIRGLASVRRGSDSFLARKRAAFSGSRRASEIIALKKAKLMKLKRWRDRTKSRLEEEKALTEEKKKETQAAEEQAELAKKLEEKNKEVEKEKGEEKKEKEKEKEKDKEKEKEKKEEGEIWDGETENKEKEKTKKIEGRLDLFRKPFIKLQCPHCLARCVTFKEYNHHLYMPSHVKAMKEKSEQLKQTLARMRVAQRAKQKKMDEDDLTSMSTRSAFCAICKLHYSQSKNVHQASEAHKKLKNFMQPYCRICRLSFQSPMAYERHLCSLEHQKKKSASDERLGKTKGSSLEYLDSFMVLDSVGSGDEVEDSNNDKTEEEAKREKEKAEKKSEDDINLGVEFIRKVEALYCAVCRTYLSLVFDQEKVLRIHCRSKYHLKCYMRFGSDELLAEVQGKGKAKVEAENGEAKPADKEGKETENHEKGGGGGGGGEEEAGIDDKIWPDVTDILSQVELDDEDEEEGSGRFDRFKSNEKKENGEVDSAQDVIGEKEKGDEPTEDLKPEVKVKEEA